MDDQNQSDELYPIAVLIDELKVGACDTLSLVVEYMSLTRTHSMTMFFFALMPFEGCLLLRWRLGQSARGRN